MQNMRAPFGAAILYLAIAAALAALGGGWLALGRIDPLFLLPGLGWATFAGLAVHRGGWRQALGWAAALTILSALLVLLLAVPGTDMPWGAWGLSFSGALLLLLGWQSAAAWLTRRAAARWLRCILGIAGAIIWLQAMGRALPYAYDIAPPPAKARVALMSALPLGGQMASFGADARLGAPVAPSALYSALAREFALRPLPDLADGAGQETLLLIQPAALPPADLVAIDAHVRGGASALILADGLYSAALQHGGLHGANGGANAAPVTSLLTPLLHHWGLELDAPAGLVARGVLVDVDGQRLHLFSPGRFRLMASDGACRLHPSAYIADCRIGAGRAILVSDADMVDAALWRAGAGALAERSGNARWLAARLAMLSGARPAGAWARPVWRR